MYINEFDNVKTVSDLVIAILSTYDASATIVDFSLTLKTTGDIRRNKKGVIYAAQPATSFEEGVDDVNNQLVYFDYNDITKGVSTRVGFVINVTDDYVLLWDLSVGGQIRRFSRGRINSGSINLLHDANILTDLKKLDDLFGPTGTTNTPKVVEAEKVPSVHPLIFAPHEHYSINTLLGELVYFDYDNPQSGPETRVGFIEEVTHDSILLDDLSVDGVRRFKKDGIDGLTHLQAA